MTQPGGWSASDRHNDTCSSSTPLGSRRRRRWSAAVATATSAIAIALPVTADAAPVVSPHLVIDGSVTGADGTVSADSIVQIVAWPSNDVLRTMRVGDSIKLQPVGTTRTAANGAFSLTMGAGTALRPYAGADGIVNLDVVATAHDGSVATYGVPTRLTTTQGGPVLADGTESPSQHLSLDLDLSSRAASPTAGSDHGPSAVTVAPATTAVPKWCQSKLVQDLGDRLTQVGQRYTNSTLIAKTDFSFSAGASSSFGIGTSTTGAFGSFKASGKHSVSISATIDFPTSTSSMHDRTWFRWGKFQVRCFLDNGYPVDTYFQARSTGFSGGANSIKVGLPAAIYCRPYGKGAKHLQTTTTASEWTNGVDTSGVLGIDLSSTTGYSQQASVRFEFTRSGELCGTNGSPGAARPGRLRANL